MAKAPAKPDAAPEAAPRKKGKLLLIVVIALLVLLIAAAGVVVLLLLKKDKGGDDHAGPAAAAEAAPHSTIDLSKPPTFVPLDPFTVNLRRDEGDHYLQAVVVLRVGDPKLAESLKAFMPEVRHRINLLLSSKLPSELADTVGREKLAEDIASQVNEALGFPASTDTRGRTRSNGPVQAVLFNSFIIQ
ncbi:flagellar basal body-associated protein FliL [Thauera sp. 2A1]|uniref:flagellar basal body-associated FliL family protein n=1 Tax=Thauera sp. 2A1 TaxID=2570191 RepID=UPI001292212D|nr:flagellar basal body-associated FliL family protein [Thauera sp. 2A1]KAI5916121.1 flagellar basal body-associated FliL family protein [Thauera sp. 2A1]